MPAQSPEKRKLRKNLASPEEEIAHLREQIKQKEQEMETKGGVEASEGESSVETPTPPEKSAVSEYAEGASENVLAPEYQMGDQQADEVVLNIEPETHDKQMDELLSIMAEEGLKNTLDIVQKLDDPHLEDDFHRVLVQYVKQGYPLDGLPDSGQERRVLNRELFEVILTPSDKEDEQKQIGELISAMEQFYAGILSSDNTGDDFTLTIEIATEHTGEQVSFYVAVPRGRSDMFEKQVLSMFPDASVHPVPNDFNIFNHDGISVGSYAEPDNQSAFPVKTYDEFDHDPLNVLLNAFSKLREEGEGAAIQLVMSGGDNRYYNQLTDAIEDIEDGEDVDEAIDIRPSIAQEMWNTAKDMFWKDDEDEEDMSGPGQKQQDAIERLQKKTDSEIQRTNIRLVTSASNRDRAEKILFDLESSFSQFNEPHGNSFNFERVDEPEKEKFFHQFVFRQYDDSNEIPLNVEELSTLVHFPVRGMEESRELKQSKASKAPAPVDLPQDGTHIGINQYRGEETDAYLSRQDRMRHFYTIGQTGTGKTNLLTNMIKQDIKRGDGCCFIDPHGDVAENILAHIPENRYSDVIYFDPAHTERPMGLNMLEYDDDYPEQKTFVVNEMLSIFDKLFNLEATGGPMFEQYFRNGAMLALEGRGPQATILEISRVLSDDDFRQRMLAQSDNEVINQFWIEVAEQADGEASLENIVPYITSKFDNFLSNEIMRPIIAQPESSFDFRQVMDNQKILIVNLSKGRLGDTNANLIGLILVGKILMSALSRVDMPEEERKPFYLYMDEFQNVSTDSISAILSEARKYQLSLNVAHQYIDQLDEDIRDAVFGNVGNMATHRISSKDAEFMEDLYQPVFDQSDLMNVDNYNFFANILVGGEPVKPFSAKAVAPTDGNPDQVEKLKQLSYLKYGRPREEVESEVMKKMKKM